MINYQLNYIEFIMIGIQGREKDSCEGGDQGTCCEAHEKDLERERESKGIPGGWNGTRKNKKARQVFGENSELTSLESGFSELRSLRQGKR